jgi:ATP-dependent Clp protease ATP-binding subunit ClpC
VLGVSKQAAHKKHARTVRALTSEIPDAPPARKRVVVEAQAREAVRAAREEAQRVGVTTVGTEHLLLGILRQGGSCALKLEPFGVTLEAARAVLQPTLAAEDRAVARNSRETAEAAAATGVSPLARACLEQSLRETVTREDQHLGLEHLLLALLDRDEGGAVRTLEQLGASPAEVRREIAPRASDRS